MTVLIIKLTFQRPAVQGTSKSMSYMYGRYHKTTSTKYQQDPVVCVTFCHLVIVHGRHKAKRGDVLSCFHCVVHNQLLLFTRLEKSDTFSMWNLHHLLAIVALGCVCMLYVDVEPYMVRVYYAYHRL